MQSEKNTMKKKLIHNLIELSIGIGLLRMCYGYIQTHPAEKISFFSGYKVLYQQTEIFFQNMFGNNGELLQQKYNLESYYQVLLNLAEEKKSCIDSDIIEELQKTYEQLKKEPKKTLEHSLPYYIQKQYDFDEELKKDCSFNESENTITQEEYIIETIETQKDSVE